MPQERILKMKENKESRKGSEIRGTLFRWSDDSAVWYEEASEYTGYHKKLTEIISPYLSADDSCCELACGTGTLARHLAPFTASYTANDIDYHATDHLKAMISDGSCPNLTTAEGDWHEVFAEQSFNTVIFSYFGAVINDWENLCRLASDKVIVIAPRTATGKMAAAAKAYEKEKQEAAAASSGSGNDPGNNSSAAHADDADKGTADGKGAADGNPQKILRGKVRSFETSPAIAYFLREKNVSFEMTDLDIDFGQPFRDMDTARAYAKYYYKLEDSQTDAFLEKKLEKTDFGWYFPKNKEISVIVIDMTTAER